MYITSMKRHDFDSSGTKLSYLEWGPADGPAIVCVHGLTGNALDFKFVGEYFAKRGLRVLAIDMPGRGQSDWLKPEDYNFDHYIADLNAFLDHVHVTSCIWLGVSMGGLLGIRMAGIENSRIEKLILVDVGPEVPQASLDFISTYLTYAPVFETIEGVVGAMKQSIGTPFYRGDMTEDQWKFFAESSMKKLPDGRYTRSFDPGIAANFKTQPLGKSDLWDSWYRIKQPVLAIRGSLSELFPVGVATKMQESKQGAPMAFETIENAGHVPSLYPEQQIEIIGNWLAHGQ